MTKPVLVRQPRIRVTTTIAAPLFVPADSAPTPCAETRLLFDLAVSDRQSAAREHAERQAIAECFGCPVLEPCREWALEHDEPWGIWGGLTPAARQQIRRGRL